MASPVNLFFLTYDPCGVEDIQKKVRNAAITYSLRKADVVVTSREIFTTKQYVINYCRKEAPRAKFMIIDHDVFDTPGKEQSYGLVGQKSLDYYWHSYATIPTTIAEKVVCPVYIPVFTHYMSILKSVFSNAKKSPFTHRKNAVCFVSSHPTPMRSNLLKAFRCVTDVHCEGAGVADEVTEFQKQKKNPSRWYDLFEAVVEYYEKYKYALVIENELQRGYVSEKLFLALCAGCIPIYYGAPDVERFVDETAFIKASPEESAGVVMHRARERKAPRDFRSLEDALTSVGKSYLSNVVKL